MQMSYTDQLDNLGGPNPFETGEIGLINVTNMYKFDTSKKTRAFEDYSGIRFICEILVTS